MLNGLCILFYVFGHCCPTKLWLYSWFGTDFLLKKKFTTTAFRKVFRTMAQYKTVFHTLAKILPKHEIDRLDRKCGQGDKRRKSSRYVQFIVMLMAQILGLKSLREIEQAQKSKQKRLYHLGVKFPSQPFRPLSYE